MINADELLSILIDDDQEKLQELIANLADHTFYKRNSKYKYTSLLEKSEGAPLISIAAYFGSQNCYEYLMDNLIELPRFKYSLFSYACAGGNMSIIRDIESKYPDSLDEDKKSSIDHFCNAGFQAISHGHLDVVKWLFLKGYNFEYYEVFTACFLGYENIFNFLFENLKIIENNEYLYDEMIRSTCEGGNVTILKKLMTNYPHKKINKAKYQKFINYAIIEGNISCLKYLLKYSWTIFPRTYSSFIQPSLEFASFFEYIDIINYLVQIGGTFDDIQNPNTPLINALTSGSESAAKYFLARLPKIPTDQINEYFIEIFHVGYSFEIIQLLLQYINKTLVDYKEMFAQLAINNNVNIFFDDLSANKISVDFIKVEFFDQNLDNYDLFIKIFELGAPLKFDINNKVFLTALKKGDQEFVEFAVSKGAIINDDIIIASQCLESNSRFYRKEDLVELLFKFNIDLSHYPNFLQYLILSCGNKTYIYEELALESLKHGAVITKDAAIATIKAKWSRLFNRIFEKEQFEISISDIPLKECRNNRYSYKEILHAIFLRQPSLVDELILEIDHLGIKSNVADMIKYYKQTHQSDNYPDNQDTNIINNTIEFDFDFSDFDLDW